MKSSVEYFRNFVFGVEDSLVSTVGLLSGIALADVPRETIFLTGVVLIFVEAFSMAAGSFLSERGAEEYQAQHEVSARRSVGAGLVMFFSYFISGFIPSAPYVLVPAESAVLYSIGASLVALILLGVVGARISGIGMIRNAMRTLTIGGVAIAVGIIVGQLADLV